MAQMTEEVTNLQHSKILRTITALLFRPGLLTAEYFSGRRIRYLKPLTLTLTVLALHLFVFSVSETTSMYDVGRFAQTQKEMLDTMPVPPDHLVGTRIARGAARQGVSVRSVEEEISDKWARNASLLQIPLILLFALALKLVHLAGRRYFAEHLVFSMHIISFTGLTVVMMWPIYYFLGTATSLTATTVAVAIGKFILDAAWVVLATRYFYRYSLRRALATGLGVYIGYYFVFSTLYQFALSMALRSAFAG